MKKRLILLLLLIGIFTPVTQMSLPEPPELKTSHKDKTDLRQLPLNQLEEMLKTAEGDLKTRVINALAWQLMYSDPDRSLAYSREAMRQAKKSGSPEILFDTLYGFGAFYQTKNQFRESIRYYLDALKLEDNIADKNMTANLLTNIGTIYWDLGQYPEAEQYQRRSLEIRKKTGRSPYQLGHTYNNLGLALEGQNKKQEALECYLEALQLLNEAGNKRGIAAALTNIAGSYQYYKKNYPKALEYYKQAIALHKEIGKRGNLAKAYNNMGTLYVEMRRFKEARKYLDMALLEAKKTDDLYGMFYIYAAYRNLFTEAGDFKAALEYSKKHDELGDRYFNDETNSHIARLVTEYDAQKKEIEIKLLRKTDKNRKISMVLLAALAALTLAVAAVLSNRFYARKKANRLLESEETKYRTLFEQAGDAIFLGNDSGYTDCNQKAAEMFGINPEDIAGRSFVDISPLTQPNGGNSRETGNDWIKKVREGKPRTFPWRFQKKDGSTFDTMVTLAVFHIDHRRLMQTIVYDITESKRLEEERVKAAKLETTTLLAGGLAHDFNNLLGVILGNIELAKTELSPNDKAFSYLSHMETSTRSAAELTHAFNTISEKEFQSLENVSISTALREAVDAVLKEPAHRPYGIRFRLDIPGDLPALECDIRQIERAVKNLVRNALEAMKKNGLLELKAAEVKLDTEKNSIKPGRYISISITDNGEGIPEENLSRIFDPYFTTRGDVGRRGLGTGLTVARSIIQRHHGYVTVSSTPEKGTTVHIYLPV